MGNWRKVAKVMPRHNNGRYWRKRATFWFQQYQSASYAIEDLNAECERLKSQIVILESSEHANISPLISMFDRLSDMWQYEMMARTLGYPNLGDWIDALRSENYHLSSTRQRSGTGSSNVSVSLAVDASKLIDALQRFDEKHSKRG